MRVWLWLLRPILRAVDTRIVRFDEKLSRRAS